MRNLKFLIGVLLFVAAIIFAIQNYDTISIKFLTWSFKTSKGLILIISLLLGGLLGNLIRLRGS